MPGNAISRLAPQIRFAAEDDLSAMAAVINKAFEIEAPFLAGARTDLGRLTELARKGRFLVGEDGGSIVASVYVELRGDAAYLGMLAVDPSRQGTGLARMMTSAVEHYAREQGCQALDITVLSVRPELLPVYRKLGFVETGTEEYHPARDLKPGVHCHKIVMRKPL